MLTTNPEGALAFVSVCNAPFLQPELAMVMMGIKFVLAKGYPIRGTRTACVKEELTRTAAQFGIRAFSNGLFLLLKALCWPTMALPTTHTPG